MGEQKVKISGHQTFTLRYGWIEKGYAFVKKGHSFSDESAIVRLGVGKNMVDSIRYWCEMAGIIQDGSVTEFGEKLLNEESGWDPYLEDPASLWLIHWNIVSNGDFKTSGFSLFYKLRKQEFTKEDVYWSASDLFNKVKRPLSIDTIKRDVDCYLRSYSVSDQFDVKKKGINLFACPLQELNIIHFSQGSGVYQFVVGRKTTLPAEVIGYAISVFLNKGNQSRGLASIQSILYQEYSPGGAFMLGENALVEAIQELRESKEWSTKFDMIETIGNVNIECSIDAQQRYELLDYYYMEGSVDGKKI